MAKINPRDITCDTECYAAVEWEISFRVGRVKDGKLYSLENPKYYMIMPYNPKYILAAFETQEELEQWERKECGIPEPKKNEQGSLFDPMDEQPDEEKKNKPERKMLDFAFFVDLFTPRLRVKALEWADAQTKDLHGEELMAWAKARMTRKGVYELDAKSTTDFYLKIDKIKEVREVFDYGMFMDECAIACKLFYFGNGGEGIPNVISKGKNGSGKFIVSSIL